VVDGLIHHSAFPVDLSLAELVPVVVALALNRDPVAQGAPRDKIDTHVAAIEAGKCFTLGPVGPKPDFVDLEFGLLKRDPHEQLLEPAPLLELVAAPIADGARAWPSSEVRADLRRRQT